MCGHGSHEALVTVVAFSKEIDDGAAASSALLKRFQNGDPFAAGRGGYFAIACRERNTQFFRERDVARATCCQHVVGREVEHQALAICAPTFTSGMKQTHRSRT